MKKLFIKTIFLGITLFVCCLVLILITSLIQSKKLKDRGRAVVIDKTKRLASLPSPKIVLVGGSNICYGLNSKILQDSLKIPVVDMSINAKVGMCFYLNQIKPYLHKGDIVIAIPEYDTYAAVDYYGDKSMYELCLTDKNNYKILTAYQWLRLPLYAGDILKDNWGMFSLAKENENNEITNGRHFYNQFGDYEGHKNKVADLLAEMKSEKNYNDLKNQMIQSVLVDGLRSFSTYCKNSGINFYLSYPVFAKILFNQSYADKIRNTLTGIRFINQPTEYLYDLNDLYNSANHLKFSQRDQRSYKLLEDIRRTF